MGFLDKLANGNKSCSCGNVDELIIKDTKENDENICGCGSDCGDYSIKILEKVVGE